MARVKAEDLLTLARKEIGYKETPANSNNTKYGGWYRLNRQPWCMMFIMWLFNRLDVLDILPCRTASCGQFMTAAKMAGNWHAGGYQPGDVVILSFNKKRTAEHCGIVESVKDGYLVTIEGNTSAGNQSNGGEVMRRNRALTYVLGAFRPAWSAAPETLAEAARAVLRGEYGTGQERRNSLARDGFEYAVVQRIVNELCTGSRKTANALAREVWAGVGQRGGPERAPDRRRVRLHGGTESGKGSGRVKEGDTAYGADQTMGRGISGRPSTGRPRAGAGASPGTGASTVADIRAE